MYEAHTNTNIRHQLNSFGLFVHWISDSILWKFFSSHGNLRITGALKLMFTAQQYCSSTLVCSAEPPAFQHLRNADSLCALGQGCEINCARCWPPHLQCTFSLSVPDVSFQHIFCSGSFFFFVTMQLPLSHSWVMKSHSSVHWRKGATVHLLRQNSTRRQEWLDE